MRRTPLALVLLSACSARSPAPPPTTPAPASPASTPALPRDLLRCALSLRAYELGAPGDGAPSAPAVAGDGFVVVHPRSRTDAGADLLSTRLDRGGVLGASAVFERALPSARVHFAAYRDDLRAAAFRSGRWLLLELDASSGGGQADRPATGLPFAPDELTAGPRGLVATASTETQRTLYRGLGDAAPTSAALERLASTEDPPPQLLASGADADLVLSPTPTAVRLAVFPPGAAAPTRASELFSRGGGIWGEASVAAGPAGFAVVRNGPALHQLALLRFDRAGAPLGTPVTVDNPGASRAVRHPRVAPLGDGWAVTWWDGLGPSLLRFDAQGRPQGTAVPLRSGDERGGHTEARAVASADAIAVTWHVHEPEFSHGVDEERPRRPGPRLGVLRCR